MWQGWVNLILGAWLILSAFVPALRTPANLASLGILIAVFGFWVSREWQGKLIGILGIWAFLGGAWFNFLAPGNFIIIGLIVSACGLWCGLRHSGKATPHTS